MAGTALAIALPAALLGATLLALPATAANSVGSWYSDTSSNTPCATGAAGDDFVGKCATTGNADGETVTFDGTTTAMAVRLAGGVSTTGNASGNEVTLENGTINISAAGGWARAGEANNNTVTINGGTVGAASGLNTVMGGEGWIGSHDNTVTVNGGNLDNAMVAGGLSENGDATGNTVNVSGGTIGMVYGGGASGTASDNSLNISGGHILGEARAGGSDQLATNNTLTVSGGTIDKSVYGGHSTSGDATGNTVNITDGTLGTSVYGGKADTNAGDAADNIVNVSGGSVAAYVYGGYAETGAGDVTGNTVTISGTAALAGSNAYGGWSKSGDASGNSVEIQGGDVQTVTGGYSSNGESTGNTVTVSGGTISNTVAGGSTLSGAAVTNNKVIISGGDIRKVYGGSGEGVDNNSVDISGGTITSFVYGGRSYGTDVTNNKVTISGGTVSGSGGVRGGKSDDGSAIGNSVDVSGGAINTNVFGGTSEKADATNNRVTISGGTVRDYVYGGYAFGFSGGTGDASGNEVTISGSTVVNESVYGAYSSNGVAKDNTVDIQGGSMEWVYGAYALSGNASNNSVTVSGGDIKQSVYGGRTVAGTTITDNTVTITGGDIRKNVFGGWGQVGSTENNAVIMSGGAVHQRVVGGHSGIGTAANNSVNISAGTVDNLVYGGSSGDGDTIGNSVTMSGGSVGIVVYGGSTNNGDANNNTVSISGGIAGTVIGGSGGGDATGNTVDISGGQIVGNIYGGYSSGSGLANHSRVILSGAPTFGVTTTIAGGNKSGNITGNVLEVRTKGLTAGNVENFEQYHFLLPASTQANDVVLALNDSAGTDISHAQVGVVMQAGGTGLQKGDRVALIHNSNGVNSTGVTETDITGYAGISLQYEFDLLSDANNLYAVTQTVGLQGQTKAPLEGRVAALAFSQQGADLIAGAAMQDMLLGDDGAFGVLAGGSSRYDTGSHADVSGVTLLAGVKKRFQLDTGSLAFGAFFESGWGDYDTTNHFDSGRVRGSGSTDYYGVGALLRHDWQSGLYAEGSLRAGRIDSDWSSNDMGVADTSYDIDTPYYGAHLGLGYVIGINEQTSVDVSARYFWLHQGSENTDIAGDRFHFDALDSHRTRVGARVNHAFNDRFGGYAGAAWEHEFDGDARATVYGMDAPAPSLEGNTGVFELGMNIKPTSSDSPLTVNLGLQGYVGQREGIGGALDVNWAF